MYITVYSIKAEILSEQVLPNPFPATYSCPIHPYI